MAVVSGLSFGDQVIIAGSATAGSKVRVAGESVASEEDMAKAPDGDKK